MLMSFFLELEVWCFELTLACSKSELRKDFIIMFEGEVIGSGLILPALKVISGILPLLYSKFVGCKDDFGRLRDLDYIFWSSFYSGNVLNILLILS